jgi:AcrR family transcriptional regulator
MAKRLDKSGKIVSAAFKLAAIRGWHGLTLSEIAAEAKVPLPEVAQLLPSKSAILVAWLRGVDAEVLQRAEAEEHDDESPRDRLFDVLMLRCDVMAPSREALKKIVKDVSRDPLTMLALRAPAFQSLGWMLEAAGIDSSGLRGAMRVRGLAVIWARVFRVWLRDGEDQAKTMAELDRRLRRAEDWLDACARFRKRRMSEAAE